MSLPTYYNYSPVFPNPFVCLKELVGYGATELHARLPWNGLGVWLEETWHSMSVCVHMDWYIILLPLLFFAGITGARFVLNKVLIRVSVGVLHIPNVAEFTFISYKTENPYMVQTGQGGDRKVPRQRVEDASLHCDVRLGHVSCLLRRRPAFL